MNLNRFLLSVDEEDWSWAKALVDEYKFGVEIVDFMRPQVLDNDLKKRIECWKSQLVDINAPITIHGPYYDLFPGSFDSRVVALAQERYDQAASAAITLNAQSIIFHSNFLPCITNPDYTDVWIRHNTEFWISFIKRWPTLNIRLENMWDPHVDHLIKLCRQINSERFGICFDIAHAHVYSADSAENWLKAAPYIGHVHISDNNGLHDEELSLGEGNIQFEPLQAFCASAPAVPITIEVIGKEGSLKSFNLFSSYDHRASKC